MELVVRNYSVIRGARLEVLKADFARLVIEAWKACYRCRIVQWVVSKEIHKNGGHHFHMAIKLSTYKIPLVACAE